MTEILYYIVYLFLVTYPIYATNRLLTKGWEYYKWYRVLADMLTVIVMVTVFVLIVKTTMFLPPIEVIHVDLSMTSFPCEICGP